MLAHGFTALRLARIDAHGLLAANLAANAVLDRLGFIRALRADQLAEPPFDLLEQDVWRFYGVLASNCRAC
jgi:RimJ/RimL family protein N-acetyltransferase